ncbi:MAG: ester cyclase [Steroidobacteraceae bacterium]
MKRILIALFVSILATATVFAANDAKTLEQNKAIALGFINTYFNDHKPREAFTKYASPRFHHHAQWAGSGTPEQIVQHNIESAEKMLSNGANTKREIKQVIAEGDLVMIHSHATGNPNDGQEIVNVKKGGQKGPKTGDTVINVFRIENGKIAEHWEVSQPTTDLKDVY